MLDDRFVILSLIIINVGHVGYLVDTIRGRARPNRVTYSLWALSAFIAFAAQLQKGVGVAALVTLSAALSPFAIFLASFLNRQAYWKLGRFDLGCGTLSLAGIALWIITGEGNVALTFSILADAFASLPTITKSYRFPESEVAWPYLTSAVACGITLLTLDAWTYPNYAFPLYLMTVCLIIFSLVHFKVGPRLRPLAGTS